ncbi:kappa-type opioid receptor-like [Branchiostoma lanceolatum]|uniref:kappa-type opioid receptor-like n=1 Tax=Branchiostoma lanceolatum TaxID=7740 RepID=UPI00345589CB
MTSFPGTTHPPEIGGNQTSGPTGSGLFPAFSDIASLEPTVWGPTVHLILAAIGSVLNALVIYIIVKKPKMKTYPNIFVLNLAVTDFVFCTVATPLIRTVDLLGELGGWLQHVSFVSYAICAIVSVLCLTTLSIERYQAISDPIGHIDRSSRKRAWLINAGLWLVAIVSSVLGYVFVFLQVATFIPTFVSFLITFVIPLLIISVSYTLLFNTLRQDRGLPVGSRSDIKSRNRVTRMVTAVVVVFVVSWLPGHILNLVYVSSTTIDNRALSYGTWACFMLQIVNSVANPFLYALLGEKFGFYIREIMCMKDVRKQRDSARREQPRTREEDGRGDGQTESTRL